MTNNFFNSINRNTMKKEFKVDIARNYVKRFPKTASLTLARKMYIENIERFKDIEDARTTIRAARGLQGDKQRKQLLHKELFVPKYSLGNPFKLPKSYAQRAKVFHFPKEYNNVLVISDLHVPYHDIEALSVAIDYGKKHNINAILINGDLVDFFQISRFMRTKRKRSVAQELEAVRDILDVLNREFPNVPIVYLKGNHCNRLEAYLADKAPELLDCEEFRLEELLEAKKHNMIVLEDNTLVKVGKLNVSHGHLILKGIFAPVNAARGTFLRAKASTLIGHVHKVSSHSETTIANKTIICYSTGCLCELNPEYNPFGNNNSHGFARIVTQDNGNYRVENKQILNGVIIN